MGYNNPVAGAARENKVARVNLSAANLIAMNGAPITLIPAPGAGRAIVVEEIIFKMIRTATPFTGGGAVEFRYTNGAGAQVTGTLAATILTTAGAATTHNKLNGVEASLVPAANAPLVITNATAAFAAGTGTAVVEVRYKIVTLP
jgi:hypothetical protein